MQMDYWKVARVTDGDRETIARSLGVEWPPPVSVASQASVAPVFERAWFFDPTETFFMNVDQLGRVWAQRVPDVSGRSRTGDR